MKGCLLCVCYLALTGVAGFLLGRILPRSWLRPEAALFRSRPFEREGKLYDRLKVRKWQSRVPDMSKILPFAMPPKKLSGDLSRRLPVMIGETCIAELVHGILCLTGLYCLRLWPGVGGVVFALLNIVLLNLPFVVIQRYNRPRLLRLQRKLAQGGKEKEESECAC